MSSGGGHGRRSLADPQKLLRLEQLLSRGSQGSQASPGSQGSQCALPQSVRCGAWPLLSCSPSSSSSSVAYPPAAAAFEWPPQGENRGPQWAPCASHGFGLPSSWAAPPWGSGQPWLQQHIVRSAAAFPAASATTAASAFVLASNSQQFGTACILMRTGVQLVFKPENQLRCN